MPEKRNNFPYREETYSILGCCMTVHKELGPGFLEPVYQEALSLIFTHSNIPHDKEKPIEIFFHGIQLEKQYKADFLCYGKIILEIKAMETLNPRHLSQVINYLKATRNTLGLLVNFGAPQLEFRRVIL